MVVRHDGSSLSNGLPAPPRTRQAGHHAEKGMRLTHETKRNLAPFAARGSSRYKYGGSRGHRAFITRAHITRLTCASRSGLRRWPRALRRRTATPPRGAPCVRRAGRAPRHHRGRSSRACGSPAAKKKGFAQTGEWEEVRRGSSNVAQREARGEEEAAMEAVPAATPSPPRRRRESAAPPCDASASTWWKAVEGGGRRWKA